MIFLFKSVVALPIFFLANSAYSHFKNNHNLSEVYSEKKLENLRFVKRSDSIKYSYLQYIPKSALKRDIIRTVFFFHGGRTPRSSSYNQWESQIKNNTYKKIKSYCEKYGYTLLIAATPRTGRDIRGGINTQIFQRQALFEGSTSHFPNKSFYLRPDITFNKIIDEHTAYLDSFGYKASSQVFVTGFSTGGNMANRFSLISPKSVAATAIGGAGIFTFPMTELRGKITPYGVGVGDIGRSTGQDFDLQEFQKIPHLVVVGKQDTNDPINSSFISREGSSIIKMNPSIFGRNPVDRANKFVKYLKEIDMDAYLKTYSTGHKFLPQMKEDIFQFFDKVQLRDVF